MTRLEELKYKRRGAILVLCTLGLAGLSQIGAKSIWNSNIFEGTSFAQSNSATALFFKFFSFALVSVLIAIPMFIIALFNVIGYSIEIAQLEH